MTAPLLSFAVSDPYAAVGLKMLVLPVIAFPTAAYISGFAAALICGVTWQLPILTGLAFVPAAFLHYGPAALVYAAVYAGCSACAEVSAYPFIVMRRARKKDAQ